MFYIFGLAESPLVSGTAWVLGTIRIASALARPCRCRARGAEAAEAVERARCPQTPVRHEKGQAMAEAIHFSPAFRGSEDDEKG